MASGALHRRAVRASLAPYSDPAFRPCEETPMTTRPPAQIGMTLDEGATAQIADLEAAAAEAGTGLPVHVEVNMGGNRCGVEPGEPALLLARLIGDAPHLSFAGLQAYHGSAQHLRTWAERQQAIKSAVDKAALTRDLLVANGIPCDNITGAGTGTFEVEAGSVASTQPPSGSCNCIEPRY